MTTIDDVPMDAWVIILRHVNRNNLIDMYNRLIISRAIRIPLEERLNTFWVVVSQARYLEQLEMMSPMPHANDAKLMLTKLVEYGINENYACELVRRTNADIHHAFELLGWN
jgi:predicted transcriptional regulator